MIISILIFSLHYFFCLSTCRNDIDGKKEADEKEADVIQVMASSNDTTEGGGSTSLTPSLFDDVDYLQKLSFKPTGTTGASYQYSKGRPIEGARGRSFSFTKSSMRSMHDILDTPHSATSVPFFSPRFGRSSILISNIQTMKSQDATHHV